MSFFKTNLSRKLLVVFSFFFLSLMITVANANNILGNYSPPEDSEYVYNSRTLGSGSRSYCSSPMASGSMILLIPEDQIAHQTVSSNPNFYFYAKEASKVPLKFNLIIPNHNAPNPIFEKTLSIKEPGVHKIELDSSVSLEYNEVYLWQIGIPCSNDTSLLNQVLKGAVKRVELPQKIEHQLSLVTSPLSKAKIYASNGIWYDALDNAKQDQYSPESVNYVQNLLKNVDIDWDSTLVSQKHHKK